MCAGSDITTEPTAGSSRVPLCIDALQIQATPGFEAGGFTVEGFAHGVTIVHGPNASGKTTIARSVQSLLWPESAEKRASLTGQFTIDDDDWWVNLVGRSADYQKNGSPVNPPNLPSAEYRDRYRLALHELLQDDTRGGSFAEQIQQESIGGYDLDAAAERLGFRTKPSSRGISEYNEATNAQQKWKQAQQEERKLEDRQDQLPRLKRKRENAKAAKERLEVLELAIRYRESVSAMQNAEDAVEEFPDAVAELVGTEAKDVEELSEQIETAIRELKEATADRADARAAIWEADLPDGGVSDGKLKKVKKYHQGLEDLEEQRSVTKQRLNEAQERRETAATSIPLELDAESDALADLSPAGWKEMEQYLHEASSAASEREAYETIDSWLANEEIPDIDQTTLQNGERALEQWLSEPAPASGDATVAEKAFRVGVVSAGAIAATAIALGTFVNPVLFVLLLLAAGLLWYAWQLQSNKKQEFDPRQPHRDSFEQLDLSEPDAWEPKAVRRRLDSIYQDLARVRLAKQVRSILPEVDELEAQEETLSQRRAELRDRYDAAPDSTDAELVAVTKGILRWQEEHGDVEAAHGELTAIDEQITESTERLEAELTPYGYDTVNDAATAAGHIEELTHRKHSYETASKDLENARRRTSKTRETIQRLTSKQQEIYNHCGLDDGEFDQLKQLCGQVDSYQDATKTLRSTRERREERLETLEAHRAYEPALKDRTIQDLEDEREEVTDTAEQFDDIDEEIRDIEADVRSAKRSSDVEEKRAAFDRALDSLENRYEADVAAMVGDALMSHLHDATEEASRPAVFSRANELLINITHGQYELLIDEGVFRAKDTVRDRGFDLDELSSATRLQLLLAVRVAFVEQQETGYKLPLLLDETLANADDERAEAIIESMIELARDGRQIIYFTAQGDEVAKWQRALKTADAVSGTTIDLTEERGLTNSVEVPDYEELAPSAVDLPDPDKHDHQSYAKALGVPSFAPREGAQSAHLWYIVGDTDVLHNLLTMGVKRWGQLKSLLDSTIELSVIDATAQETIYHNGAALEEYVKSWRVGRGKRVDRTVLKDSGAVSSTFIDEVSSLAQECNGDAEAIIDALDDGKVNRWRSGKTDELEQYFRENEYLSGSETLPPETIRIRVVSQFTRNGYTAEAARDQARALFIRLQQRSNLPGEE